MGRPQTETQYGHDCESCVVDRQEPQGISSGNEPNVASVCYIWLQIRDAISYTDTFVGSQ